MFTAFMVALTLTCDRQRAGDDGRWGRCSPRWWRASSSGTGCRRAPGWPSWWPGCGIAWMYATKLEQGELLGTLVALCVPLAGACNWTVVQHAHRAGPRDRPGAGGAGRRRPLARVTLPLAWPLQASAHDLGLLAFLGLTQLAIPCVLSVVCARVLTAPEVSLLALLEISSASPGLGRCGPGSRSEGAGSPGGAAGDRSLICRAHRCSRTSLG